MSSTTFINIYTCGCVHDGFGTVPWFSEASPVIPALIPGQPWIEAVFNAFPCSDKCYFNPGHGSACCDCELCQGYDNNDIEILSQTLVHQDELWWDAQMLLARVRALPGGLHAFTSIVDTGAGALTACFPHLTKAKDYLTRMVTMVEEGTPKSFFYFCTQVLKELTMQHFNYLDEFHDAAEEREFEVAIEEADAEIEAEEPAQEQSNQMVKNWLANVKEGCAHGPACPNCRSSSKRPFNEYQQDEDLLDLEDYDDVYPYGSPAKRAKARALEDTWTVQYARSLAKQPKQETQVQDHRKEVYKLWCGAAGTRDHVTNKLEVVRLQFNTPNTYKAKRPRGLDLSYDKRDPVTWFGGNGLAAVPGACNDLWAKSPVFKGYASYPFFLDGVSTPEPVLDMELLHMAYKWRRDVADYEEQQGVEMETDESDEDWQETELKPDLWEEDEVNEAQCALPLDDWQEREMSLEKWEED